MKSFHQIVSLAIGVVFFLLAAGCLVTTGKHTSESGTKVSNVTLDQIRPGQTTESWLLAAAGEPSSRRPIDEHASILRYDHVTTTSSNGTVFLLFSGGSTKKQSTSVIFEVRDGVVQRYWTET